MDGGTTWSSGTGTGGACSSFNDTQHYFGDMQLNSECWTAGAYQACGHSEGQDAACSSLQGMLDCCYSGSASCPYC